ncbi:hypothetical protein ADEAN_000792700 [Angomonas deanei]|uniref:Uncharacterized protein n=1 Tax=Angomonas deanei TaxID=59799 RepID=A0A7G2CLV6_9TRYP|nr:hypothetical protein ADEAN_000792700 [Angomonas deanei]
MVVDLQHRYTIILQEDLLSYSSGHKEETCGGVWLVESGLTVSFKNGVVRLPWKYYSEKNNNNTSSKHKRSTYYKEQQTAAYLTIPQDIKEKLKRLNPGVFNHQNNNNNNTSMDFSPLLEPFMALGENSFVVCEEKNNMQLELSDGTRLTRDNMVWWSESEDTTKGRIVILPVVSGGEVKGRRCPSLIPPPPP